MSEEQKASVHDIVLETLEARQAQRNDWPKFLSAILGCVVAVGTMYSMFLQPSTVAQAAQDAQVQIDRHSKEAHVHMEKRLDRIETKLDKALEK